MPRRFRRRGMGRRRRVRRTRRFRRSRKSFRKSGNRGRRFKTAFASGGNLGRVPRKHWFKAYYAEPITVSLQPTLGNWSTFSTFGINTLFACNTTHGGPSIIPGLTEMGLWYNSYRIRGCTITATFINTATIPNYGWIYIPKNFVAGQQPTVSTTPANLKVWRGQYGVKVIALNPIYSEGSKHTIKVRIGSFQKHYGDPLFNLDAGYVGTIGAGVPADPAKILLGYVGLTNWGSTGLQGIAFCDIRVDYHGFMELADTEIN